MEARRSPLTTHVLDTSLGKPGAGIRVTLSRQAENDWDQLGTATTDKDGRIGDLFPADRPFEAGTYRLVFASGEYFAAQGRMTFFPMIEVIFRVENATEHYHVPLLLSPFGYSTYRGS